MNPFEFIIVVLCIGLPLYLLPTFVAVARKHRNKMAIAALNILLGWSVLGWVGSLVWSLSDQKT